jgi:predicted DCC family thiol-disulfide oxidoreductase YuxK
VATEAGRRPLILYDGVCGLCNSLVQFVLKHDTNRIFQFAALQGQTAPPILQRFGESPQALDTMYVVTGDRLLARSDAAMFIAEQLGGIWEALGAMCRVLPKSVRGWTYNQIARRRYKFFGQYETCPLPDASVRERFLE